MSQANVKIAVSATGQGSVVVDGVDVSSIIKGADVKVRANNATEVVLELAAPDIEAIDLTGTSIAIKGTAMPPSIEAALFTYLCKKNGIHSIEATNISSDAVEYAAIT